jgi:hypothetical protein
VVHFEDNVYGYDLRIMIKLWFKVMVSEMFLRLLFEVTV